MTEQQASEAVRRIVEDLNDRAGLGIDGLEPEIQGEIRETWIRIIVEQSTTMTEAS